MNFISPVNKVSLVSIKVSNFQFLDWMDFFQEEMIDDSVEILVPVFSLGGHCEQFWHEQRWPHFDVVYPAFPLPTTASPTLQDALKNGFREAAMAYDMPKIHKLPSKLICKISEDFHTLSKNCNG